MRAYSLEQFGSTGKLALRDQSAPVPGPGEVTVRIRATSLNYRDLLVLRGQYPVPARPGTIPLSDGVGEVVALGEGVRRFAVGDRLSGTYFPRWMDGRLTSEQAAVQFGASLDGFLCSVRAVPEDALVRVPAHLSDEEAATLPCAAVTAWSALTGGRPVCPGETVLTLGTGGVALFAVQFAKLFGARVIALTSTGSKQARLRGLGADEVMSSRDDPDWHLSVRRLTNGRGVDHVVETVGPPTLERSIQVVGIDGHIALVGAFAGAPFNAQVFGGRLLTLRRVVVGSRVAFEAMNAAVALHALRPVVDRVFAFEDARLAYEHYAAQGHLGKVVIAGPLD